jgi:hypothetical protein
MSCLGYFSVINRNYNRSAKGLAAFAKKQGLRIQGAFVKPLQIVHTAHEYGSKVRTAS